MFLFVTAGEAGDDLIHQAVVDLDGLDELDEFLFQAPHFRILQNVSLQGLAVLFDEFQRKQFHPARFAVLLKASVQDLGDLCGEGAEVFKFIRRVKSDARFGGVADDDLEFGVHIRLNVTIVLTIRVDAILDHRHVGVFLDCLAVHLAANAGVVFAVLLPEIFPIRIVDGGDQNHAFPVAVLILSELDQIIDKTTNEIAFAKLQYSCHSYAPCK